MATKLLQVSIFPLLNLLSGRFYTTGPKFRFSARKPVQVVGWNSRIPGGFLAAAKSIPIHLFFLVLSRCSYNLVDT